MFKPNKPCVIVKSAGSNVYGQPRPAIRYEERCAVVSMEVISEKTSVRADSSASRGSSRELQANTKLLMTRVTVAEIDDLIAISGYRFRIMSKFPRFDLNGSLDHYEVTCTYWSEDK